MEATDVIMPAIASDSDGPIGLRRLWPRTAHPRTRLDGNFHPATKANIVIVHGVSGNALNTWKHANGTFWPVDLLPHEEGFEDITIYTWGHRPIDYKLKDGVLYKPDTLFGKGEALCNDLMDNHIHEAPITFLGHGIGGIIIKSALDISHSKGMFAPILGRTQHVIFMDTPHLGISRGTLQSMCRGDLYPEAEAQYELWSTELGDLGHRFVDVVRSFRVSSACSSLLREQGILAEQAAPGNSARLLSSNEQLLPTDLATHEDLCRYENARDVNYRRLVTRIRNRFSGVMPHDPRIDTLWAFLKDDSGEDAEYDPQLEHKQRCSRIHADTCNWLFKHSSFESWKTQKPGAPSTLWVTGPSGVGKTFLCSAAIDHVQSLSSQSITAFEVLRFDLEFHRLRVLRRLASNLLEDAVKRNVVPETVSQLMNRGRDKPENVEAVIEAFLLSASKFYPVYIFVDGINEVACDGVYDKRTGSKKITREEREVCAVIEFLLRCTTTVSGLRLWFSSQSDDRTSGWLNMRQPDQVCANTNSSRLELKIPEDEARLSVLRYLVPHVEAQIKAVDAKDRKSAFKAVGLLNTLTKAADNFRWAAAMVSTMEQCSNVRELLVELESGLPLSMITLYDFSLQRLQNEDAKDARGRRCCVGYSSAILSVMAFTRRPLRLQELQEAIASYCNEEPGNSAGLADIDKSALLDERCLVNRCVPFVTYIRKEGTSVGTFRLAHQSVYDFLMDRSNHARKGQCTSPDPMIDARFMAKACLRYLLQRRFSRLLEKHSTLDFTACGTDVRNHKLLQYAAKYWYRHVDDTKPTVEMSNLVVRFVKSTHFITALQVQSLFVPGHFIQDLDCDDPKKRSVKKNLPDSVTTSDWAELKDDYLEFLAEWGPFLQRGENDAVNGEMNRCLWGSLSPRNYFSRHRNLQRYSKTAVLMEESNERLIGQTTCCEISTHNGLVVTVWKIQPSSASSHANLHMSEATWEVGTLGPSTVSTRKYTFSMDAVGWDLYDPGLSRALSVIPSSQTPERVPPVASTSPCNRIRVGSTEFAAGDGQDWPSENGASTRCGPSYWENIQVNGRYRVKSRRRLVQHGRRYRRTPVPAATWTSSDESSENDEYDSEGSSNPSYGAMTPEESIDFPTDSSEQHTDTDFEEEDEAVSSVGDQADLADIDFHDYASSCRSPTPEEVESNYDSDTDDQTSSVSQKQAQNDKTPASQRHPAEPVQRKACDKCPIGTGPLKEFYECSICMRDTSFDLCSGCINEGHWCKDRFHTLTLKRQTGTKVREKGTLRQTDCRPNLCLIVETLDGDSPAIFRYQEAQSKNPFEVRQALYDSHPRFHPSIELLVWPLGRWRMLFANISANKYYIIPSHGVLSEGFSSAYAGPMFEIKVESHFSTCGGYLHILTVYASIESNFSLSIRILLTAYALSKKHPFKSRPKEIVQTKAELGRWHRQRLADQPFSMTWSDDNMYLTCSSDRLCVYKLPLKRSRENTARISQPSEEVTLPRTARCRKVQFFPNEELEYDGIIIIGPRDGENSLGPIVIHLPAGALGKWNPVEKAGDLDLSKESRRKGESLFETFDQDDDCDLLPVDPNFRV